MKYLIALLTCLFLLSCNTDKKTIQQLASLQHSNKAERYELGLACMRYILQHRDDIEYNKSLVRKLLENGFYEEAIYAVETLLENSPKDSELFYLRGLGYRNQHQYELAMQDFNNALKIQPQNKLFTEEAGSTLEEQNIWNEINTISDALVHAADSSEILLDRAQKLFSIGQYDAVLYDLGSVSKMGSRADSVYFTRSVSSLYQEGGEKSVEILAEMVKYYQATTAKISSE